jgi:glutaredoxin-like protein NrdH
VNWIQVDGAHKGDVKIYALSTCGWCKKTKAFLRELGVEYSYADVDQLSGSDRNTALQEVERWNPNRSFPTVVINDREAIVGYRPEEIKAALGM